MLRNKSTLTHHKKIECLNKGLHLNSMKLFSEIDILINGPLLSCYIYIEILGLK